MIAHQATCVAIGGRGVLIEGAPGSGKSALALALIDRGAQLVGDDSVLLRPCAETLIAHPHPNTRGLVEIRNLGLVHFDPCEGVEVALLVLLKSDAPRFREAADAVKRGGIPIPAISLWPAPCPPVLKVEHALHLFGRPASKNWI